MPDRRRSRFIALTLTRCTRSSREAAERLPDVRPDELCLYLVRDRKRRDRGQEIEAPDLVQVNQQTGVRDATHPPLSGSSRSNAFPSWRCGPPLGADLPIHTRGVYSGFMPRGTRMHQRINITLPADTVRLLDRVAPKGDRSRFIDEAVREQAKRAVKSKLRKELKEGYLRENETNRQLAEEWFLLDEEAWQTADRE